MVYSPEPDVVYRPSGALIDLERVGALPVKVSESFAGLELAKAVRDVRMSIKEVFIIDNRDFGKGDIILSTLVADGVAPDPVSLEVKTFQGIADGESLQLGPAGLAIYRSKKQLPRFLDYRILLIETDEEIREAGKLLEEIKGEENYKKAFDNLLLLAKAGQPSLVVVEALAKQVIDIVATILKMNRDDQLIYVAGSLDARFDDLGTKYGLVPHKNRYAKVSYQVEAM